MLRRLAAGALASAVVGTGLVFFAGSAAAAQCPTTSPQYPAQTCGISTNKTSVDPGGAIVVKGEGYSRNCGVTIAIDGTKVDTGKTNSQGKFTEQIRVPSTISAGKHTLTAADQCSAFVLGEQFTVNDVAASSLPFTGLVFWPLLGGGV